MKDLYVSENGDWQLKIEMLNWICSNFSCLDFKLFDALSHDTAKKEFTGDEEKITDADRCTAF